MESVLLLCLVLTAAACKKTEDPCPSARQFAMDNLSGAIGAATTAENAPLKKTLEDWMAAAKENRSIDLPATPPKDVPDTYVTVAAYQKACHAK